MGRKVRLDRWLVERGLAESRQKAQERIAAGDVLVDGIVVDKSSAQIDTDREVRLKEQGPDWVGRGARKLDGVLDPLGIDPAGRICADLGASTGGFTEVLLRRGAAKVYAVDVGKAQLHERLARDPRVVVLDEVNARHLQALPEPTDLVVADLSFISVTKVLLAIHRVLRPGGEALVLVKPQFEVGPAHVGRGGRVADDADRQRAIEATRASAVDHGFVVIGGMDSPLPGARAGNVEFFLHLRRS